jgi:hypothetical protein
MNHLDKLPDEIYEYIAWLSCGPINLEISNKAKKICEEINYYKNIRIKFDGDQIWHLSNCCRYGLDGVYLKKIADYQKTPELEIYKPIFAQVSSRDAKTLKEYFAWLLDEQQNKFNKFI